MADNSVKIFYDGEGHIRSVAAIPDITKGMDENVYTNAAECASFDNPCYLDDPYEGELFAFMMYLFSPLSTEEKEKIFVEKRFKLQLVDYYLEEANDYLTVQKGWWFSAHETWKYLFLPYLSSPINKQIFLNGEKVRTWNSNLNKFPGMFASITSTIASNDEGLNYFSDCGVQEAAFEKVGH
jgi:hypothetical protein